MTATFRIWRGGAHGGEFRDYRTEISEGMVVLDAVNHIQATQANDLACRWNCKAGKCGSCSAEVNGMPKLMYDANERVTARQADHGRADESVSGVEGFGHGRFLEFPVKKKLRSSNRDRRMHQTDLAHAAGGYRSSAGIPKMHRVFSLPGRLPRAARSSDARQFIGPRFLIYVARSKCIRSIPKIASMNCETPGHRLLQHHEMLHKSLSQSIEIQTTESFH
jgi:hypothetical protein